MNSKSILTMSQLSVDEIMCILNDAMSFSSSQKDWQLSKPRLIANLFFEPSTRTHYSFASAEHQLGCKTVDFTAESSSTKKGESLYDTVKTFEVIGYEGVVIRHNQDHYFDELKDIQIPILNAGDGCENHPSQCLLDLLTLYQEFHTFKDIKLLIVGDINHSRVANSNVETLARLGGEVRFSGPTFFVDRQDLYLSLDEGVKWADAIMMLRIQHERHSEALKMNPSEYLQQHGLTKKRVAQMKEHAIIMHPAPVNRDVEIESDLVEHPKSRIFKQMANGVLVRKAMIKRAFDEHFEGEQ